MTNNNDSKNKNKNITDCDRQQKTATDNQWTSNTRKYETDDRDRRDGPGGEDTI